MWQNHIENFSTFVLVQTDCFDAVFYMFHDVQKDFQFNFENKTYPHTFKLNCIITFFLNSSTRLNCFHTFIK